MDISKYYTNQKIKDKEMNQNTATDLKDIKKLTLKPLSDLEQVDKDIIVATKFMNIRESASSRGLGFGMTLKEVDRLMHETTCFY